MSLKKIGILLFLILLSVGSIRSFFSTGFFPMHDDAQVARVIVMAHALQNGQFPVRVVSDLGYGYGYPIFNFYGPLPYYIGGFFHMCGLDALTATKIMIAIAVVAGSFAVYLCSSSIFGPLAGLFSAVFFTYFPYRAVQIYVRGAVGELWAVSFVPLVLFGLLKLNERGKRITGILISGLSLSAVILSHTVFGYIFLGGLFVVAFLAYIFSFVQKRKDIRLVGLTVFAVCAFALGVTAFFWIPAITEMPYTNVYKVIGETADYKDHFICFGQLWDSLWGFGGSAPGCLDGMSFKLGKLNILYFFLSLFVWIFSKEKEKRINGIMTATLVLSGLLLFLTLQISLPLWKYVPYSSFVQYPWRFLGLLGIGMSVFCGYLFYKRHRMIPFIAMCFLAGAMIITNSKLFSPQYLYTQPVESFGSSEELRFRASKVSDEYLPSGIKIPENASQVVSERVAGNEYAKVTKVSETETKGTYKIESTQDMSLKLNMGFFPGWTYSINGAIVKPEVEEGQPSVILSSGVSLLELRFTDTPARRIGNWITLLSIVGIVTIVAYGKKIVGHDRHTRI